MERERYNVRIGMVKALEIRQGSQFRFIVFNYVSLQRTNKICFSVYFLAPTSAESA